MKSINPFAKTLFALSALFLTSSASAVLLDLFPLTLPGDFPDQEEICSFDQTRENLRIQSAQNFPTPQITAMSVNGIAVNLNNSPTLRPGDIVTLTGTGFGSGVDIDFSKIMIGNSRILETDVISFEQELAILNEVNYETPDVKSVWQKDVISWNDTEIEFTVPIHVSKGPLIVQVQKRTGYLESLIHPNTSHNVIDTQTGRIIDPDFQHNCDVVSTLTSESKATSPIAVTIDNPQFYALKDLGQKIYWSYDYNIGLSHEFRNLEWDEIMKGKGKDPLTGNLADPLLYFGAYKTSEHQVPLAATEDVYFAPYPQLNPTPGFLGSIYTPQLTEGMTRDSGYVGYRYAESMHPLQGPGEWIGFNCASCHGQQITYENAPGNIVNRVFGGLPNPRWSMKWSFLRTTLFDTAATDFDGITDREEGPAWNPGNKKIDKAPLINVVPAGAGEHNLIRLNGEGSLTDNDYQFSPITIPNVTHYMAIRRSLSHTESYVGFEGSYVHAEEPDGALGSMDTANLQALTAYMTTLDQYDDELRAVGLYRWLKGRGKLDTQVGQGVSEGTFVQAVLNNGFQAYPTVAQNVAAGEAIFNRDCASCHSDQLGYYTNEQMLPINEVGRFFAPTIYQKEMQATRVTFLRDVYFTQTRGLLTDGHIRNAEDLVHPDRCAEGTDLYNQYYTLHPPVSPALGSLDHPEPFPAFNRKGDVFRVKKASTGHWERNWIFWTWVPPTPADIQRNRFIERHKYFVEVPWDDDYYYWDYQKLRAEYGPDEMGTSGPIGLPASPHPYCTQSENDVDNLVQYMMTL